MMMTMTSFVRLGGEKGARACMWSPGMGKKEGEAGQGRAGFSRDTFHDISRAGG